MSSKSANYCFANQSNDVGLLLLCEVSLLLLIVSTVKVVVHLRWPATLSSLL